MALRVKTQISGNLFIFFCEGRIVFGDEDSVLRRKNRSIAEKVQDIGERVRDRFLPVEVKRPATGTNGKISYFTELRGRCSHRWKTAALLPRPTRLDLSI